jgi:hypothetical protein
MFPVCNVGFETVVSCEEQRGKHVGSAYPYWAPE